VEKLARKLGVNGNELMFCYEADPHVYRVGGKLLQSHATAMPADRCCF